MSITKLSKNQYVKLKNLSYCVYLLDREHSSNKAQRVMKEELEKYDDKELKIISYNTLLFPFDVELYNFLLNKKMSDEDILQASEKFDIPMEVVRQKISEYVKYQFIDCVNDGTIDYNAISELAKQLLNSSLESEKNPKVS